MKNPQAFPRTAHQNLQFGSGSEGMTLLDYFAGQALTTAKTTWSSIVKDGELHPDHYKKMAKISYDIAQAMLDEREKHLKE